MDKLIGKKLDGCYEILALIGSGGMANVYKAMDLRNNRIVSVKVLREEFMGDHDLVCRFKNESKAISILHHDNIVKVFDVSVTDKLQYIVMEFIDGITLRDYLKLREHKLTWRETIHFVGQVLEALQHAHENGVVHRDVKPQNIMLLPSGDLKMMDFGIARIARAEHQLVSGKAMGSVHYISPEQAKGDVTDAKSDIYSVGVMMYEMLSGKLPFATGTVVEVAIQQISDKPVPLAELVPEMPYALVEITERAMAKNPEDRYQSVAEMREAIAAFKADPTISFEYKYMTENATSKVIDKVMNKKKSTKATTAPKKAATKSKKRKKSFFLPILFGITIAFAIGCALLCDMILKNSDNPLFSTKADLDLQSFTGLTVEQVKASDQYDQLKIVFEEEYNSSVSAGLVYKQSTASGRTVKEGQTITLTVSLGTKYVEIGDFVNMMQSDAKDSLTGEGLNVLVIQQVDSSVAVGAVIKTEPAAGEVMEAGGTVYLYVSMTQVSNTTTMPDVLNLTIEDATTLLTKNRISIATSIESYSDLPSGTVIGQSIEAGTEVSINSRVVLTVSKGSEPVATATPTVIIEVVESDDGTIITTTTTTIYADGTIEITVVVTDKDGNVIETTPTPDATEEPTATSTPTSTPTATPTPTVPVSTEVIDPLN